MEKLINHTDRRQRRLMAAALSGNLLIGGLVTTGSAAASPHIRYDESRITVDSQVPRLAVRTPFVIEPPITRLQPIRYAHVLLSNNTVKVVGQPHEQQHHQSSGQPDAAQKAWLKPLRVCESDDTYSENTGNGYYGAYQFSIATWDSLHTGYALASEAPPAVQDRAIIENTERSSGGLATQNPGCYEKEGLSQFPPQ